MTVNLSKWFKEYAPVSGVGVTDPVISLGAASGITGLSDSALRKYESVGLIIFYRTPGNRRRLSLEDIERIKMIQSLIREKGLNLQGILRLWTLIPCWELKQCSKEISQTCPAITDSETPCWVLHKNKGCYTNDDCRLCEVYRFCAYCTEDLKSLVHRISQDKLKQIKNLTS